ncbi:non-ribosomal peptide synthetase/type I polyketide synthase [Actinokineospora pegani]|uniref:non-ribosomal peptide synthetase/type I polyketide synthase n=1 Tax=Actinokineospora pegani TaxID=2654637 RepID=UPI0018D3CCDC|nr:non-ribosomal peptide synthetase/type I polyketide synthase [Actinokineospora pegani]
MSRFDTLTGALLDKRDASTGICFIDNDNSTDAVAYPELVRLARGYLAFLQDSGVRPGDELVVAFQSPKNVVIAYWAALFGGITPVPLAAPKNDAEVRKVVTVWGVLGSPWLAFDDQGLLDRLHGIEAAAPILGRQLHTVDCAAVPADREPVMAEVGPDDIAFIQFSSGSTGNPKGVTLTHRNLLRNIEGIVAASDIGADDVFLSWKPLSHDFGMIAFHLAPLVTGAAQHWMTTKHFIWKATDWLAAASRVGATILGTTNSGVQHFLSRYERGGAASADWDLSRVRVVMDGAEMVSARLCHEFVDALRDRGLGPHVIRPTYGLAENTLVVAQQREDAPVRSLTVDRAHLDVGDTVRLLAADDSRGVEFVVCGTPHPHSEVKIVDDGGQALGEDQVGLILVRGDCVTAGYYRAEDTTREVISDGWLNTQDVGFLHDGHLVMVGRRKEVIIIGGVNFYPADVEDAILADLGRRNLGRYVACAVPNAATGADELVVFAYFRGRADKFEPVAATVRRAVMTRLGLKVVDVVPVRSVPKTTSGKVQRLQLVKDYLARRQSAAEPVGAPAAGAVAEIVAVVNDYVALGADDHDTSLFDLGCTSTQLISLQEEIQRRLGTRLEHTFIIDFPTVNALVAEVARRAARPQAPARPVPEPVSAPVSEPVAVIGVAFRLPGGIRDRQQLWAALSQGTDVIEPVPADRWRHSPLDTSGVTTTHGGYLRDVDRFDPLFFGISPAEAELIDPQQRLLLEATWEAFEDAGIAPLRAGEDQRVGVFVGITLDDYVQVGKDMGHSAEAYTYTGTMANAAAGRISYAFGFRGPSVAIDTACSSSMYAVHQASRELRQGGCELAVAAGVNLILSPEAHVSFSRLGALSPSGRVRSFDDGADGYIRSEGVAAVILKRLSDAERDGDSVLAVITGSAVNHNGRSGGFTVPSGAAQTRVIEDAMAEAGVGIEDVSYVEAHGSGTPIGDPQEVNALARVFAGRSGKLRVGSVKSNLGHLEAAAGMAGLCKVLVSLEHGRLPATMHFRKGNHLVDWDDIPVEVVSEEIAWEPAGGRRRAGISSFGINGSNAHVIVEEYPGQAARPEPAPELPRLLTVSGNSATALRTALTELSAWSAGTSAALADIAHTLTERRSALRHREVLVCDAVSDIPAAVEAVMGAAPTPEHGRAADVFVFAGQGTQYPGMGRELYEHAEVFRRELDEIDGEFQRAGGASPLATMFGDDDAPFRSPLRTQPMIFAIELALARYWRALGITPSAVIGHSIGEYAAACFAGAMDLAQAVDLVLHRARTMEDTPRTGGMATLLCSLDRAEELLRPHPGVCVAAVNAAENITVSGQADALTEVLKAARGQRVFVERLDVSHPFHSAQMAEGAERLHAAIRDHRFTGPAIPWISSLTGEVLTRESGIDAAYWSRHLVEPVRFRAAVATAVERGARVFVEIGAMATVGGLIAQEFAEAVVVPSLRKGRSDVRQVLESAGALWKLGRALAWDHLPGRGGSLVRDLPRTPFDRSRVWYADRAPVVADPVPSAVEAAATDSGRAGDRDAVVSFVRQSLSAITGVAPEAMDESLQLFALGLDSLMLVQLSKRLEREHGVAIPIKAFFESVHTIGQTTDFVLANRPVEPDPVVPVEVVPQPVVASANGAAPTTGLEDIIQTQLALMRQQLALLGGAPTEAAPAPAAPARKAVTRKVGTYTNNIALADAGLGADRDRFVRDFVARFTERTRGSKSYAETHRAGLADWIASLNFNPGLKESVYPLVSSGSRGATFLDVDGNEYVDTTMGYGVHFFGHQPDFIVDAVAEQLRAGYELGPQTKLAGEVAQLVHELAGVERVAFCNTGSEAVMVGLRLARAVTGRDRVAKFAGSYHGGYDGVLAEADGTETIPMTIGVPQAMVEDTLVLDYGSAEALDRIRAHGSELAAVLVEPVQSRNPLLRPTAFLRELRQVCTEHGIALVFDEMITGFRVDLGGAQAHFGVEADIVLYGKLVGGGMPIGVVAGKARYLDAVDGGAWTPGDDSLPATQTTFFAGTFCKHPLTMAAAKAVLTRLRDTGAEEIARVNRFTDIFARRANEYFEAEEVPLRIAHCASFFQFESLVPRDPADRSMALNLFFKLMTFHGVYVWERRGSFFSLAHNTEHQDRVLDAIGKSVAELRGGGFDFRRAESTAAAVIDSVVAPDDETTPVSSQEKRIYVLSRMRGGNEAYQIISGIRFAGAPDLDRIAEAFQAIARKHEKLRGVYEIHGTEIRSRVVAEVVPERHVFDLARDPGLTAEDVMAVMNKPFDLATAPLWRYGIVIDQDGTHHLVVSLHHIMSDFTSLEIILKDLDEYLSRGGLTESGSDSYSSFVRSQAEVAAQPDHAEHRRWWLREFETIPKPLALPTDSPHPLVNDFAGRHHHFEIDGDLHAAAKAFMAEHRTTPATFFLALWAVLLAKATGEDDLCVGIPMDQRMLGSFEGTVGMFAQSLPLRVRPTPDTRVLDLLHAVRDTSLAAMEHSPYSYDVLVGELALERDFGRNALFDVMFTFQNARGRVRRFGGVEGTTQDYGPPRSTVALSLDITERDGGLFGDLSSSTVYSEQRIAELIAQFRRLVATVVREPDRTVGELSLLDHETTQRLLDLGAGPVIEDVPSLASQLERALGEHARATAIRFRGQEVSYADLADRVDRCASVLQARGAVAGDVVGLLLPPSPELITLMLAVNRIGCAWLPMDVKNPVKRLRYMIDTAGAAVVVCAAGLAGELGDRALVISEDDLRDARPPTVADTGPDGLAYVIFTSGSTGNPKGVRLTNGSLANFLRAMPAALRWAGGKSVACLTTPSFDIHLLETLLTLVTGGTVVVAEESDTRTPADLAEFVAGSGVDYLQMTPTRLRLLFTDRQAAAKALAPLEKLIVGGESFPENLLADLRSHESLEIFNVYGPTETCIWSSVKELTGDTGVTIGTPIGNTTFFVLDDSMQLVPEGRTGNLWIGGHGVSPGYLDRPELTAAAFRANPFGDGRVYLTGDLARWQDGEVHCLGRIDNQVKVRGYRIELDEIELAITGHDLVTGAATIVRDLAGGPVIRGFYRVRDGASLAPDALKDWLAESLPDYMVPATLTEVADIPMTMSGKVDRKALAERAEASRTSENTDRSADHGADVDQGLLAAWRKILGDIPIGLDDSFFDIGGNSFSLVLLLEELNKAFPQMLDVSDLFANPTIGKLHKHLTRLLTRRRGGMVGPAVRLPESWSAPNGVIGGLVEATLPEGARAALDALRVSTGLSVEDLLHATFALTLSKVLGHGEVELSVVDNRGGVAPVRFDFAGKADLAEVLEEYRRGVDDLDVHGRVPFERFTARRGEGGLSIACCDTRWVDQGGLRRHFDIVFGARAAADRTTIGIDHPREVDPTSVERLLGSHLKLLGLLQVPATT